MTKLIANMVVRNEQTNYLPKVLERLMTQVDELYITDDHSDDDTAALARAYGAKVMVMDKPTFTTHEGRLREASWGWVEKHITEPDDTWVLAIDADEMLFETQYDLRTLINQKRFDVLGIWFHHMWNETQYRVDKLWVPNVSTRLFRYVSGGHFADRQMACGSEPTYVQQMCRMGRFYPDTGLCMKHLSYIRDEDKLSKYERYDKLDGGAFHQNEHIQSIIDKDVSLVDWVLG